MLHQFVVRDRASGGSIALWRPLRFPIREGLPLQCIWRVTGEALVA